MIHIDDLIRQRMSGAEEGERPGAWLGMKELLDKQMPVEAVVQSYNWRRLLGYGAALLLFASVSLGGYKLYESSTNVAGNSAASGNAGHISASQRSGNTIIGAPAVNPTVTPVAAPGIAAGSPAHTAPVSRRAHGNASVAAAGTKAPGAGAPVVAHHRIGTTADAVHSGEPATVGLRPLVQPATAGRNAAAQVSNTAVTTSTGNESAPLLAAQDDQQLRTSGSSRTLAGGAAADNLVPGGAQRTGNESAGAQRQPMGTAPDLAINTHSLPAGTSARAERPATALSETRSFGSGNSRTASNASSATAGNNRNLRSATPAVSTTGGVRPGGGTARPLKPVAVTQKDTLQMLELVQHRVIDPLTRKLTLKLDTISSSYVLRERAEPALGPGNGPAADRLRKERRPQPTTGRKDLVPAAAGKTVAPGAPAEAAASSSTAANADNNLVSLAKFRVSSTRERLWNPERYDEMVRNFKFNLARVQLYAGITGGINAAMFTPNTFAGFNLGLTGMMVFNERWSMMAELKYFQRFNTGDAVRDDYRKIDQDHIGIEYFNQNGIDYKRYSWTEDDVDHYYNFSTRQSVELPVSVRYTIGRFFTELGANLMYGFAINVEEVEVPHQQPAARTVTYPASQKFTPTTNDEKRVRLSDFNSRFGVGYLLGIGYQCSPALNVSLRMTKELWDNASTVGGKQVSGDLYRAPSMQLSIGYRFSQSPR